MSETLTREEGRALLSMPKRANKYKAKRALLDGICFDSKAEASYYAALKLRMKAGEVCDVEYQRPYALTINGMLICTYKADFVFWDVALRRRRVVDVKGVETPAFKIKRKLMKACHGIDVEIER